MRRPVKVTGREKRSMAAELAALRTGVMDAEEFVRRTFGDWNALGEYLAGRWELPPGVDAEDARQEMLLALFEEQAVASWDPARQVPLARYVVWNACASTKQYLHKQRGALRWSGKAKSRFPVAFSMLGVEEGHDPENVQQAEQEGRAEARELLSVIGRQLSTRRAWRAWALLQECGGERGAAAVRFAQEFRVDEGQAREVVAATILEARAAMAAIDAA